jgi:preprotein translocase subunit YajC
MLISPAYAQTAGAGGGAAMANLFIPMILIFVIFWFLVLRPEQQRAKAHRAKLEAAKKGDEVVTGGGIVGKVTKVENDRLEVEIASGVRVKVLRATLADVNPLAPAKPAND